MTIEARPRYIGEPAQVLDFMRLFLMRAVDFVFALRPARRAQVPDERVELVTARAGA